jgi:hypothetical protein
MAIDEINKIDGEYLGRTDELHKEIWTNQDGYDRIQLNRCPINTNAFSAFEWTGVG